MIMRSEMFTCSLQSFLKVDMKCKFTLFSTCMFLILLFTNHSCMFPFDLFFDPVLGLFPLLDRGDRKQWEERGEQDWEKTSSRDSNSGRQKHHKAPTSHNNIFFSQLHDWIFW